MAKFVTLTNGDGDGIAVNPSHVVSIEPGDESGTSRSILLLSTGSEVVVRGTVVQLARVLSV